MKPPQNRRVFVIGYATATALGKDFATTWKRAVQGEAGFRRLTRCTVDSRSNIVGEIPQWNPREYDFVEKKDAGNWNAAFVFLTMGLCAQALDHAGLVVDDTTGPRTACLIACNNGWRWPLGWLGR